MSTSKRIVFCILLLAVLPVTAVQAQRRITGAAFQQEVLNSWIPVLVVFDAAWCGPPCRAILPKVQDVAREYSGRLKVVLVDVDGSPGISGRYGATPLPVLLLFKNGQVVDRLHGDLPRKTIAYTVEPHLP